MLNFLFAASLASPWMAKIKLFGRSPETRKAHSAALFGYMSIFFGKFVSIYAVGFSPVFDADAFAAFAVHAARHGFKVNGIYAASLSTKMIQLQAVRDGADEHLVRHGVPATVPSPMSVAKAGVALLVKFLSPQPARYAFERHVKVYADLREEARENPCIYGKSVRIILNHLSLRFRFDGNRHSDFRGSLCLSF